MTCQDMSCVYDSSGGAFPDGYCVWVYHEPTGQYNLWSCHCREGYCCGQSPASIRRPYDGQRVRQTCRLKAKPQQQQQQ